MTQQLPQSSEAEQALLSSILNYSDSMRSAVEYGMSADDFYVERNKRLFAVLTGMYDKGDPLDITSVLTRLNDTKEINRVGGLTYLMELYELGVSSVNIKHYMDIIQNKAYLRNLILTAQKIAQDGFNEAESVDDVMDQAERQILSVTRTRRSTEFRSSKEVVKDVMDNIRRMNEQKSNIIGMNSGYQHLDRITNGFQPGDLIILAARPSMGKSAFALNVALNSAQITRKPVAIFSLEMPAEQLIARMLSVKSRLSGSNLRIGMIESDREWNALNEAAADLRNTPLYFDDMPNIRVAEIFSKCRKLQSEHGLGMIIIDYIQLITGSASRNNENRQQEVSEISRSLKALAREMKVPVIALSQLSRNVETRADKKPQLSDLRESGALEQDADLVMFLYRESYYQESDKRPEVEVTELNIAKHRNGQIGTVKLAFESRISAFFNYAGGQEE